jgi:hypothetical protein
VISWLKPDWPAPPGVQVLSTYRGGGGGGGGGPGGFIGGMVGGIFR